MDAPKTLANEAECKARSNLLSQPHMQGLMQLVERIHVAKGIGFEIPDFDPLDGGIDARVLFLLEAPGRKAIKSGFVSRNNPDETAKNFFLLNLEAGIGRRQTVIWNAVPWYLGSGIRIRPARHEDIREADRWLEELLALLHQLRFVVFVGKKSLRAKDVVRISKPQVEFMEMPHPSPMFVNRSVGNRSRIFSVLQKLSCRLKNNNN